MARVTSPADQRWYRFGPFVADAQHRLLWRDRSLVPLTSKAFEILLLLIANRRRTVEKEELMEAIWPNTAVEENTLTRQVSTVRKALEERPNHHQYILTVPGHGYQFVGDVLELDQRPRDLEGTPIPRVNEAPDAAPAAGSVDAAAFDPGAGVVSLVAERAAAPPDEAYGSVSPAARKRPSPLELAAPLVLTAATTALVVGMLRFDSPASPTSARALRQVTYHGGLQRDPAWSPDGRRLAYTSDQAGNADIWIQTIGEPTPVQLTSSLAGDSQPDWSPDGGRLVFRSEQNGGGLYVMPVHGGGTPQQVSRFGYRPRWSSTGALILFSSSDHPGGTARFHVVGLDGRPPRPLRPDVVSDFTQLHVAWRPDGRTFSVWGRLVRGDWTFVTAPLEKGRAVRSRIDPAVERRLEDAGVTLGRFVWSRSGRHAFFEGRAHETQSLWRVTVDPATLTWIGGPERLTSGTTSDSDPALSADDTRLAFSARTERTRLWMFPFDAVQGTVTGAGQPVTSGGAGEQDADVPDDGSRLAFRTTRGGAQQLWVREVSSGTEQLVLAGDQWARTRPRWSPDGTRLAYLRRRASPPGSTDSAVAILSVNSRRERLLTTPGSPGLVPMDWSPDGKWLLGGCRPVSARAFAICMMAVPPDENSTGTIRTISSDPRYTTYEQRFSPDQRWISFIAVNAEDAGVSTIHIMPAAGTSWTAVTDGTTYDDKPHWAPDGRTIYFVSPRNGVLNLWGRRVDPQSGKPGGAAFQVTSFDTSRQMISPWLSQMQIALTANRLFLPITESQGELWILDTFNR